MEVYSHPLERFTVQVQLSRRKCATIYAISVAPVRSAGKMDIPEFSRMQLRHMAFIGDNLNAHSPFWDTDQLSDPRSAQLEDWTIAHSVSVRNDGAATLLNHATGGLTSPELPVLYLPSTSFSAKHRWPGFEMRGTQPHQRGF